MRLALSLPDECDLGKENKGEVAAHVAQLSPMGWLRAENLFPSPFIRAPENGKKAMGELENVIAVFSKYIKHLLRQSMVFQSPLLIQKELATELYNYLLAHISHNLDNLQLRAVRESLSRPQNKPSHRNPIETGYFRWVHFIAADGTSCPFSFRFFTCLISTAGTFYFQGP
ncbi:hypothetical protein EV356DRAFT_121492 [Viridothelium virens]|uniref:Uncharacterized protein n=1 Tax=Viridothelium virens TaxID=1048519 RepID=A0A6A6HCM0_VIRVR|nr:hypothetical protein EV356DRAFT_121492 [Viridothelium virens]